ncbi:hypothetical protein AGMMS49546_10590 [Spirochaetia bacterium]|nr:hypothetical protein AGMMS49546_10590 [Spirochaetia bacterium]
MGVLDIVKGLTGKKDGSAALIDPRASYRTDDQEKAVFYFSDENKQGCFKSLKGCFKKPKKVALPKGKGCFAGKKFKFVSDAEYDALIQSLVQRLDPKTKALAKLNIDESEIEKAITFGNFKYKSFLETGLKESFYWKIGEDGLFRSSIYEVTWIFFTQKEILAYQLTLSSDWEKHDERTFEYHYKDITAFSSKTIQEDQIKDGVKEYGTVENVFQITVPGDSFSVVLSNKADKEEEDAIQALKGLLREKKA